jgi:hypothetical protein
MNLDAVRDIADTVLYEGYVLYPYRASAQKNRSRWQFGVLMPPDYVAVDPSESALTQTECVLEHTDRTTLQVIVRLLQVQQRSVQRWNEGRQDYEPADVLDLPDGPVSAWDEAVEREVTVDVDLAAVLDAPAAHDFHLDGGEETQLLHQPDGVPAGRLLRRRVPLAGRVTVAASAIPGPWHAVRLRVGVLNRTVPSEPLVDRGSALPAALVATHLVIAASEGRFVSSIDPPEWARAAVQECVNVGAWPVLAGPAGGSDVMLAAPIILYDHPELAPESPGALYDSTEIDEILTLRTLALSDEEKREARATDPRAAAVIDRTDAMDAQTLDRLHGAIRYLRTVTDAAVPGSAVSGSAVSGSVAAESAGPGSAAPESTAPGSAAAAGPVGTAGSAAAGIPGRGDGENAPWWDPASDASVDPETDTVMVGGTRLAKGSQVRLRPGARRSDAQDMFLAGRAAEVAAVLLDVDDNPYLAVVLRDDPAADLALAHGRYLYFSPDEVEPV